MNTEPISPSLVEYIFRNYRHLMTSHESWALRIIEIRETFKRDMQHPSPIVQELTKMDSKQFCLQVAQRILEHQSGSIALNYCPNCGNLVKTPQAKLCLKCGHSWFDKADQ